MPIPVNNNNNDNNNNNSNYGNNVISISQAQNVITIQNVFIQVIHVILSSRLALINQQKNYCLNDHTVCCFSSSVVKDDDTSSCIVINILQKESNLLLERWMMSFDDILHSQDNMDDRMRFIQNVSHFIRQMPAKTGFIDMYSIAFLNNNDTQQCHSHISTQERIEFRTDAHLKAQRFHLSSLSLEVVFDDNASQYYTIPKKPIISLQSLSSPLFMPWSKMQQNQHQGLQNNEDIHPLSSMHSPTSISTSSTSTMTNNLDVTNNNNVAIPIIAVRRLSRLSLSAIQLDDDDDNDHGKNEHTETEDQFMDTLISPSTATTIPIPSPRMQYTHHGHHAGHRTTVAYSTSPNNNHLSFKGMSSFSSSFSSCLSPIAFDLPIQQQQQRRNSFTGELHYGCLVGSFEESLLSGRMSSMPSKPITFHCQIGVLGYGDCKPSLKCPPHWSIVFPAMFYKLGEEEEGSTPYVGTVDIGEHVKTVIQKSNQPGYRIPPKGQLQVVVKNPNKTAVKLFLIPYDFTDMPKNAKTFLRQKSYTIDTPQQLLRKADAREKFKVICEGPKEPAYMPL